MMHKTDMRSSLFLERLFPVLIELLTMPDSNGEIGMPS
jgi:hypothetical protein